MVAAMPLEPGSRIGPFEVLSRLGAGGMGEVWRARDTRLQRDVAIKILSEAWAQDADRLARFTREAHVLASLNHPNIAAIYSFEEIDGVRLLVLELVLGETLKQRIVRAPVSANEAIRIALQIADALEAAHEKGVLHRDLKPANVALTPEGKVKLLDFGLAKAFALGAASPDLSHSPTLALDPTHQGVVLGTASYMSPEQARSRALDGRSDLWAFGCVLYETLSGRKAFDGETVSDILVAILDREPDWSALPSATPPPLVDLLKRLLRKSPAERPATVAEVKGALEAAAGSRTTAMISASSFARLAPRSRIRAFVVAAGAVALAAAAFLWFPMRERPGRALPANKLLAILPATDLTGRADGRQLCDGLSFSLGVKLWGMGGVDVMPPSSPAMLKDADPVKWARDTGANLLVQPAIRQMGAVRELSFSIALAGSPVQIAAGRVEGPADEQFRLEDQLVAKIVDALQIHLATGRAVRTPGPAIPAGPAQTDYVVALGYLRRYDDAESLRKAVGLLMAIPGGERTAEVQAALARASLYQYAISKDSALVPQARAALDRAVALGPDLPEVLEAGGLYATRTGRPCDAVKDLTRALEKKPRSVEAVLDLADALEGCGRIEEAEKTFRRGIDLAPSYWSGRNRLGVFYFSRGRWADAERVLREAVERNPDVARVHNTLGAALLQLGRFDEAEKSFQRAVDLQPDYANAWSNLGTVRYYGGKFAEAAEAFRKSIARTPKSASLWANLGDALVLLPGKAGEAKDAFAEAIRLGKDALSVNPASGKTLRVLGRASARSGNVADAQRWLDEAVKAEPANPDNHLLAAILAHVRGDDAKAVEAVRLAVAAGFNPLLLGSEPAFGPLLKDPSFQAALKAPAPSPTNATKP